GEAMSNAFVTDLLASITERGRALLRLQPAPADPEKRTADLIDLCEKLLTGEGEASGTATARAVLDRYRDLDAAGRTAFFETLARAFGPDTERLARAVADWQAAPDSDAGELHLAS